MNAPTITMPITMARQLVASNLYSMRQQLQMFAIWLQGINALNEAAAMWQIASQILDQAERLAVPVTSVDPQPTQTPEAQDDPAKLRSVH